MDRLDNFNGRMRASNLIEDKLDDLFSTDEVEILKFGRETITDGNAIFVDYLNRPDVNNKASSMIVKFAPDYILLKKTEPKELYFLEVKTCFTPCWAAYRVNRIRELHGENYNESNIGDIAREALLSYKRFYPNTIVICGSSYNSKVLMAQFADRIECLYCYRRNGEYDCNNCPSENGEYFDLERDEGAIGSGTPNTNISLDSFEVANEFFENIGIHLDRDVENSIIDEIKRKEISFFNRNVDANRERGIRQIIHNNGCDWITTDYRYYSCNNNNFYHSANCLILRNTNNNDDERIGYYSEALARRDGKIRCKYCMQEID